MTTQILRTAPLESSLTTIGTSVAQPSLELQEGRYRVRLARDVDEVAALQRLRFDIFNRELGEGLASAWQSGRDEDAFDRGCHHLLVEEVATGAPVGTYRLQTAAMARAHRGFYSAGEFALAGLTGQVLESSIEVGRACVAREHRNTRVLFLLWRGLARYVAAQNLRYLFGCASITSQRPAEGLALLRRLTDERRLHPTLRVEPLAGFECRAAGDDAGPVEAPGLPPLFRIYLRHGAWICGAPAIDREFGTIDFLVLFDVAAMDSVRYRTFFG